MRTFISQDIVRSRSLTAYLFVGLAIVVAGILMLAATSQTTLVVVDQDLSAYWRTSYDILVRPKGSRLPLETEHGLVEPNHLSGIDGGIKFDQYLTIKNIPGVDVAAPIAMLGYLAQTVPVADLGTLPEVGAYRQTDTLIIDDGVRQYINTRTFYYYAMEGEPSDGLPLTVLKPRYFPHSLFSAFEMPILLAAIDPSEESSLIGLDKALLKGDYFSKDISLYSLDTDATVMSIPVLINSKPYINLVAESQIEHLILPEGTSSLNSIVAAGGSNFLITLPGEQIIFRRLDGATVYQRLVSSLLFFAGEPAPTDFIPVNKIHSFSWSVPSQISYRQTSSPLSAENLMLEVIPSEKNALSMGWQGDRSPAYRSASTGVIARDFSLRAVGVFDIERLPKPADVNRVPLETYFPPVALLSYDEQGNSINPPREVLPTLNPAGYIQPPPLILTTLEAARAMRGDDAISAIRVRVALDGCPSEQPETCTVTPAGQRKIEAIAIEIQRRTGLDVDIMVGSSPTRVLVHVPGVGYVEEQWIQKGVNLTYKQGIQSGNWLLLGTLLLAGGLFTLDLTWAEVLSRRRVVALQKALGWRSRSVFAQVVRQVMMIGAIATAVGTLIAMALIRWLKWEAIPSNLLIGLPLLVIGLCGIGSLLPAWSASRVSPIVELQRGGVRYQRKRTSPVLGLWMYAWSEIKRRTVRSILTGLGSALSAGLLTLLLGVTLQQRGMLNGTLLGEFILVNVEGYHYAIVGIGLGLAFLSTFNGLLGSILERRREIGVLKAVGWRTDSVARLFIAQGIILGIVGGSFGALAGAFTFFYLYQSISADMTVAILLGISLPGLVGALAALYPARLAAKVPPAEAVRYE